MTDNSSPKVSVCIPTYNYGKYISDAIESALAQTFTDFELIVVDNCSIDGTKEIVEKYVVADSRVKYYCNESNVGMVGNWNKCLEYARGDYVKILCADDLLINTCLEKSVDELNKNNLVALVTCNRLVTDMAGNEIEILSYPGIGKLFTGRDAITKCFIGGNLGEPTAVLFRREDAIRGFCKEYKHAADIEMWFYILRSKTLSVISENLCVLRVHEDQTTKINQRDFSIIDDEIKLYNDYKELINVSFIKLIIRKLDIAYLIWCKINSSFTKKDALEKISKHCNAYLFYLYILIKKIKRLVKLLLKSDN